MVVPLRVDGYTQEFVASTYNVLTEMFYDKTEPSRVVIRSVHECRSFIHTLSLARYGL